MMCARSAGDLDSVGSWVNYIADRMRGPARGANVSREKIFFIVRKYRRCPGRKANDEHERVWGTLCCSTSRP